MAAHPTTPRRLVAVAATLLLAALAAGCSASQSSMSSSSRAGAADRAAGSPAQPEAGKAPSAVGGGNGSDAVKQVVAAERQIARTAALSVQVKDVAKAAATVRAVAAGADGYVLNEQMGKGGSQPAPEPGRTSSFDGYGTITLSVPSSRLDSVLDQLARVGTVLSRTTSSQDVTDQYVDTQSRVRTMTASIDRVRALLARATTIGQVVSLESELSRREADLESLQAQLASLKGSVERSSVTVTLSTPATVVAPTEEAGFLAGLRQGWQAFQSSVTAVLTVVGALLPFAVLLGLVGWPVLRWLRRRQASVTASPASGAPAAP